MSNIEVPRHAFFAVHRESDDGPRQRGVREDEQRAGVCRHHQPLHVLLQLRHQPHHLLLHVCAVQGHHLHLFAKSGRRERHSVDFDLRGLKYLSLVPTLSSCR